MCAVGSGASDCSIGSVSSGVFVVARVASSMQTVTGCMESGVWKTASRGGRGGGETDIHMHGHGVNTLPGVLDDDLSAWLLRDIVMST